MARVSKYHYIPQILLLVVCGVILKNMSINTATQTQQTGIVPVPESTTTMATAEATSTLEDDDDVEEIFGVKIHRNPSQSKLDELGVASWPTWEGGPGKIPWTFSARETMYLLEGKVKVCCEGHEEEGETLEIGGGDLVEFPKGMKITWHVVEAVKKRYNLDKSTAASASASE